MIEAVEEGGQGIGVLCQIIGRAFGIGLLDCIRQLGELEQQRAFCFIAG